MIKRLISFLLVFVFLVVLPLSAAYRYNPYTRKLDYYEAAGDIVLGDIGDITLTGLATGNILYYDGAAWVNLATGANTNVLTLAAGIPSWAAPGAPAAHAATHEVGGADLVDHNALTNWAANRHLVLPNTLAAVLTDHNIGAHTALGLFDASMDVDHDLTTNYVAAQHLVLPSTIAAVLTDHNVAAHNALNIDADTVDGEHAAAIVTNARVKAHFPDTIANVLSDHNLLAHTALGLFDASADVDHNATTNYAANQHLVLPATIAAVLTDHNLAAHTALGLYDAPGDVDHDLTTNYVAAQHLALPSTIAAVLTDHNLAAHTALGIPNPANVFYVSATGGDYTTIQAALNAQNAGGETFLVGPGTYAADTIAFTANDQVVKALGNTPNVIVTQADANIVDGGAWTDCMVQGIEIRLTAPTTAIHAIQVGTGTLILFECRAYLATAIALVQADQPSLVGFTGAGTIRIKRGNYQYYHTGNTGAGGIKAAFRANVNLAELHLHKIDVITITNSGTAAATTMYVTTGTAVTEMHNVIDAVITDPNATLVVGLGYVGGAGAHNVQGNHVDVVATNNTSYGLYHNGTATIRSAFNAVHASDAAGASYAFYVGASATLISHFDDLRSDDGNNVAGTLTFVNSPADGDLEMTDELDVGGVSEFSGDTNQYEDVLITWADAADVMDITQSAVAGPGGSPLINIDDDRTGVTVNTTAEATLYIDADGSYAFHIADGWIDFGTATQLFNRGDWNTFEDVFWNWSDSADHAEITQSSVTGIENQPLIYIEDERAGATVDEAIEATLRINADGPAYGLYIQDGAFRNVQLSELAGNVEFTEDIDVNWADAADRIQIIQNNVAGIEAQALIYVQDDRTGATANEADEASLYIDNEGQNEWAFYAGVGKVEWGGNVLWNWGSDVDNAAITQAAVAGIEDVPLINIADARTGVTVNETSEATIYIDAEGAYAFYVADGYMGSGDNTYFTGTVNNFSSGATIVLNDDVEFYLGTSSDTEHQYRSNSTEDAYYLIRTRKIAADDSSAIFLTRDLQPWGATTWNDWLSPTWIQTNDEAADANDYAGVIIGERAQASVLVAHYFDFYAMTGAADGSVDPNAAELAAIFRFGPNGTGVPGSATTPGDVLFEGAIESNGRAYLDGGMTSTGQSAFGVTGDTSITNIPINTNTTITFNDESTAPMFDQGGNFNTGTYTFTADVAGRYIFTTSILLLDVDTDADNYQLSFVATGRQYRIDMIDPGVLASDPVTLTMSGTVIMYMAASETIYVRIYQTAGAAQTDVDLNDSYFSGSLLN